MTEHAHDHAPGPLADASVRRAGPNDAAAVGLVQEAVWAETYAPRVPEHIAAQFTSAGFASVWRRSLASPPPGVWTAVVPGSAVQRDPVGGGVGGVGEVELDVEGL